MNKILLADDHCVIRTALKILIKDLYLDVDIHEASNGDEVTAKLKNERFDLVIMDIRMPETDALKLVEFIRIRYKETKNFNFLHQP